MPTSLNKYLDPVGLDETVVNIRQLTEALEAEMQELPYARPDGLYPDMTVGAVIGADETAQWATRESTGSGAATVRSVQGAAVVCNQIVVNGNFESASYWAGGESTIVVADGVATITPISDGTQRGLLQTTAPQTGTVFASHKYYIGITCKASVATNLQLSCSGNNPTMVSGIPAGEWTRCTGMWAPNTDSVGRFYALASATLTTADTLQFKDAILVDLTQMFGSGNEPSTVAEFERMYPATYYPYSAPTLKPVQIAGIASTDAQGGELDAIEWTAQTLWGVGDTRDVLTSDDVARNLNSYTFTGSEPVALTNWRPFEGTYAFSLPLSVMPDRKPAVNTQMPIAMMADVQANTYSKLYGVGANPECGFSVSSGDPDNSYSLFIRVPTSIATDNATLLAWLAGKTIVYAIAEPTTTPISPALPMSYKVQAGGSESIIVPAGEVSAAPVLTIAEPVNMSTELARIWEAIQSLGYTRNVAQLSRPVSLTDIGSIDEVQKDTAEIAEIGTIKEVQE